MIDQDGVIQFNDAHIKELRSILKLDQIANLDPLIGYISGAVKHLTFVEHLRSSTPDIKTARARALSILEHANALQQALQSDPMSSLYFKYGSLGTLGKSRSLLDYDLDTSLQSIFAEALHEVAVRAKIFAEDERHLRANSFLPSRDHSNQSTISQSLWPSLFEIYLEIVGRIAYSPSGPLERFMRTVHDAAELPPVAGATLKFVLARWKRDKARPTEV